mgnify:CR=1
MEREHLSCEIYFIIYSGKRQTVSGLFWTSFLYGLYKNIFSKQRKIVEICLVKSYNDVTT